MKNIFMALALVVTSQLAQATSIDMTKVIATVSGMEGRVISASVLADRRLQVTSLVGSTLQGKTKTTIISEAAFKKIEDLAQNFSNVNVIETHNQVVCMMVPRPELSDLSVSQYNYQTNTFEGQPKLILTALNCAVSHRVVPESESQKNYAMQLRAMIAVLALNTVK